MRCKKVPRWRYWLLVLLCLAGVAIPYAPSYAAPSVAQDSVYTPFWLHQGRVSARGEELLRALRESWRHGLNPASYDLAEMTARLKAEPQAAEAPALEALMTRAYIHLGQDLSGIRVNPAALGTQKQYWKAPYTPEALLRRLAQAGDVFALLESFAPQGQTYKRLQAELETLLSSDAPAYDSVLPLAIKGTLDPYEKAQAVPALRVRLGVPEKQGEDASLYDEALATAVIAFQRENGLKPDGIVGGQTLEILNITRDHKIRQVLANLERLRWVYDEKPEKFVMVNIPSATLWGVENGQIALEMPVIVGRKARPTNMFVADITGVRFHPNWTVPPTIKKDDILPKLQADSAYLSEKGMALIKGSGAEAMQIDPASVDWATITAGELAQMRMVQIPGAHNPLGRVRILMPNVYNIYLHDTNQPEYFNRAGRAESSGCVRLSAPEALAAFLMKARADWSPAQMEHWLLDGKTRDIGVPYRVPVYMLYHTMWVDRTGRLIYGNDLYGYDKILADLLKKIDGLPVFAKNE